MQEGEGGPHMIEEEVETLDRSQHGPEPAPPQALVPSPAPASLDTLPVERAVEEAKKRAQMVRKITEAAVAESLYGQDWIDQNGKPWLAGSGAERLFKWLMRLGFKLSRITPERLERTDKNGAFYVYVYKGIVEFMGSELYVEGECSARDQFFAKRWEEREEGKREQILLPAEEVDESNIRKAALTNLYSNAVTRLLGLRNLTWEQVQVMGFDRAKAAKVTYRDRKGGGEVVRPAASATPAGAVESEMPTAPPPKSTWVDSLEELLNRIIDERLRERVLQSVTSFERGEGKGKFAGYATIADIRTKSKNAETVARIAYHKLLESATGQQTTLPT